MRDAKILHRVFQVTRFEAALGERLGFVGCLRPRCFGPFAQSLRHAQRFAHAITPRHHRDLQSSLQKRHGVGHLIAAQQQEAELRSGQDIGFLLLRLCFGTGFRRRPDFPFRGGGTRVLAGARTFDGSISRAFSNS